MGQMISLLEQANLGQVDLDRFADDGGAPSLSRPDFTGSDPTDIRTHAADPTSGFSGDELRVSLAPVRGQGSLDGGWRPRTLGPANEFPDAADVGRVATSNLECAEADRPAPWLPGVAGYRAEGGGQT